MKTPLCTLPIIVIAFSLAAAGAMQLDYSTGEYVKDGQNALSTKVKILSREEREIESKKLAEAKAEAQAKAEDEKKLQDRVQQRLENEQRYPWMKLVMPDIGIVTNDYVNTTSNSVIITILDYARAANDGVKDRRKLIADYRLCLLLHPGDKYHEIGDGGNGVRLARYVQAHQLCQQNMEERYGDKYLKRDNDGDGITDLEEIYGTNIVIRLESSSKKIHARTFPYSSDSDSDGLTDGQEILGFNGFVTDPNNPDTDGDGVPDGSDSNPLQACVAKDNASMPEEWARYWSGGKSTTYEKLLAANGDADNDGYSNHDEFLMKTNPCESDRNTIVHHQEYKISNRNEIIFVQTNGFFEGEFSFVFKDEAPRKIKLDFEDFAGNVEYLSSIPLSKAPKKSRKLFSTVKTFKDKKRYYTICDASPYTIHTFKLSGYKAQKSDIPYSFFVQICKGNDLSINNCIDHDNICFQEEKQIEAMPVEKFPKAPKLTFPQSDFFTCTVFTNAYAWVDFNDDNLKLVHGFREKTLNSYEPKLNLLYKYEDELSKYETVTDYLNQCSYSPKDASISDLPYQTTVWGVMSIFDREYRFFSEMRPLFKTERLALGKSFVFEPKSLDEIRDIVYPL